MNNLINGNEIQGMVSHAFGTPPNGYLGSGYGIDLYLLLQNPMRAGVGDKVIDKLVSDVPILGAMPDGSVNLYLQDKQNSIDEKILMVEVAGSAVALGNVGNMAG